MGALVAAFSIIVLLSLSMLIFFRKIGERVGRDLNELKLRALFQNQDPNPSRQQQELISKVTIWLIYTSIILGILALVWGIACLVLGVYEAGTALLFCVILASIMVGILLQVKKQRLMWKEEADILQRALAQARDTVAEDEKLKGD